jgi:hypothetical protein
VEVTRWNGDREKMKGRRISIRKAPLWPGGCSTAPAQASTSRDPQLSVDPGSTDAVRPRARGQPGDQDRAQLPALRLGVGPSRTHPAWTA